MRCLSVMLIGVFMAAGVGNMYGQGQGQGMQLSEAVRGFVSVGEGVVALTSVRVVDGTGARAREGMTVVISEGRIQAVGPAASTRPPRGARVIDLPGHTVMPGIIGLHDHMYYSSVGGSMKPMLNSYPRLFLAAGVTTIRTTGSVDPYQELNLKAAIAAGQVAGPEIFVTGPYLQGAGPGPGAMHPLDGPDDARRMVRYWAEEGVSWFKAYTQISRAALTAAIDEAHRHGVKVTAHLCSVGFREAVAAGIDNLEHGLLVNTEYQSGKQPDVCPSGPGQREHYATLDINSAEVQRTIREMVANNVSMTSTLAVMELSTPDRVPMDERVLDAVFPDARKALVDWRAGAENRVNRTDHEALRKAMEFERAFVAAGGTLAAGSDPCCLTAIAGYADQRNFELLVEAGFTPEQAVQIMSANGAKVLGIADRVGTILPGLQADLVVVNGDITSDPSAIRNITHVFRKGIGFDPVKLTESVRGLVGIR
ncbi:MAG: amidohydrolase family protein [Gemmatimonadetes bacterium]|nr:amidohydrolase family protein [Gemmatimonadota bacterium]